MVLFRIASSPYFNMSLLTSDFYGLLFGTSQYSYSCRVLNSSLGLFLFVGFGNISGLMLTDLSTMHRTGCILLHSWSWSWDLSFIFGMQLVRLLTFYSRRHLILQSYFQRKNRGSQTSNHQGTSTSRLEGIRRREWFNASDTYGRLGKRGSKLTQGAWCIAFGCSLSIESSMHVKGPICTRFILSTPK